MAVAENPGALLQRDCPSCGRDNSDEPALEYSWQQWLLRRCTGCGFVYLENPPDYADFKVVFAWERNHGDRKDRMRKEYPLNYALSRGWRKFYRWAVRKPDKLAKRISRWVPPGRLIDIGCGNADRLVGLPPEYEVFGVEISEALAREGEALLAPRGGRVINLPAIEGLASVEAGTVSGVLMRSFLEHEHQPVALLTHAARVLKPGGVAIIKVPNFASVNRRVMGSRWCGFRFPGHVNHFTPASLSTMVADAGLTPVGFDFFDRFPLSDNMWMVVRKDA
jgi:SAM-dependent methyltransferase